MLPPSKYREKAIPFVESSLESLKSNPPRSLSKLLMIEGHAAEVYFYSWRALEIKWRAISRYPIPDEWKRFFSRSAVTARVRIRNKRATHPINAMLNYAYSILEASTRIKAIADGYDPTIGIMHDTMREDKSAFAFDLMEPMRPVVDRAILKLIKEQTFSGADFVLQQDGVCRLNPEMARTLTVNVTAAL